MTTFSLQQFKAEALQRDFARTNLFEVMILSPLDLGGDNRLASLFCDSAVLPTQNIVTKRHHIYGESYPRPVGVEYGGEIQLTFLLDADMIIKSFFDDWLDMVVDRDTNNVSYQFDESGNANYFATMQIAQLKSKEHEISYEAEFDEIFPVHVEAVPLDNNISNTIQRLSVTFSYRKWFPSSGLATNSPTIQNIQQTIMNQQNLYTQWPTNVAQGIPVTNFQGLVNNYSVGNRINPASIAAIARTDGQALQRLALSNVSNLANINRNIGNGSSIASVGNNVDRIIVKV